MPIGSDTQKRKTSLLQAKPETVVDISDKWRNKKIISENPLCSINTYERLYVPASNIERKPEDGCMKKILIERSLKLRREDFRSKNYNVITNNVEQEGDWMNSFSNQKDEVLPKVAPIIEKFHSEKSHIANNLTIEDRENNKLRVNMDYKPKMTITHQTSTRY
jgi:hypothetical protein